jgi:hypothetical protein
MIPRLAGCRLEGLIIDTADVPPFYPAPTIGEGEAPAHFFLTKGNSSFATGYLCGGGMDFGFSSYPLGRYML